MFMMDDRDSLSSGYYGIGDHNHYIVPQYFQHFCVIATKSIIFSLKPNFNYKEHVHY